MWLSLSLSYLWFTEIVDLKLMFFTKFGKCLAIISSSIFLSHFLSFLCLATTSFIVQSTCCCPTVHWGSACCFSPIFVFIFYFSDWIISICSSSLILSSAIYKQLSIPFWEFFIRWYNFQFWNFYVFVKLPFFCL